MVMTRKIHFDHVGAIERHGKVVLVIVERFTEDRLELEMSNPIAADILAEEITAASDKAARRIDGELLL